MGVEKRVLHLSVKSIYFNQIKSGEKKLEYRLKTEYWARRLIGREYDEVHIKLGYPKSDDHERIIIKKWKGFCVVNLTHEHFGNDAVDVFAIALY